MMTTFRRDAMTGSASSDVLVEQLLQFRLVGEPDDLLDELSALEEQQGRNPADAEAHRRRRVLVDVHLRDHDPAVVIVRELVDRRGETPARTAPFRPEI